MKIRTRLKLNTWFSLGAVIFMLLSLAWSFREAERADQNVYLIHEIERAAVERIILRDDWLLNREDRARTQWYAKTETLRGLLESASQRFTSKEAKDLLKDAREDFKATFLLFPIVLEKHKREERAAKKKLGFTEAESRVISQLFLNAYSLNSNISRLHEHSRKAAIEARNKGIILIIVFIIGGITAMVINSVSLNAIVAKRVATLANGIKVIGNGNLDYRIEATGDDELSDLARESNKMVAKLKASQEYSESIINTVREPLIALDQDLRVVSVSHSFYEVFKVNPKETVGQLIYDLGNKQWDIPKLRELLETVLPQKTTFDDYEVEHDFAAIGRRIMLLNARQIQRVLGKERIILLAIEDITEKKKLERGVVKARDAAEAANKELEAFSYSVSHDLRAPLRSIDGFSHVLLEDYQGKLDAPGKNYLERIRKATQHMGNLIDDLLKLSRVTQSELHEETINLSKMIQKIAQTYKKSTPGRTVKTVIQEEIIVQGDSDLMQIALTNLIDNAWKFTGKQKHPRIEFGATLKEGKKVFFVRDNGVGFDMSYVGKLFGAFQRLHTMDEFTGTGIGLATVQRIINRHEGKIWAEGEVGKGATFYFTIPAG